jgi:hypothetical protein
MRSIVIGPSGSGKIILLQNMILDIYDGCFDKIYIFSPSVHLDHTWQPVKEYIKDKMKVNDDKDHPVYFDEYEPDALLKIIDTQTKVTTYMKKEGKKNMFQVLIIIDDFADNPQFSRNSKI